MDNKTCLRCGATWQPRKVGPDPIVRCPRCQSLKWDVPKKEE